MYMYMYMLYMHMLYVSIRSIAYYYIYKCQDNRLQDFPNAERAK